MLVPRNGLYFSWFPSFLKSKAHGSVEATGRRPDRFGGKRQEDLMKRNRMAYRWVLAGVMLGPAVLLSADDAWSAGPDEPLPPFSRVETAVSQHQRRTAGFAGLLRHDLLHSHDLS